MEERFGLLNNDTVERENAWRRDETFSRRISERLIDEEADARLRRIRKIFKMFILLFKLSLSRTFHPHSHSSQKRRTNWADTKLKGWWLRKFLIWNSIIIPLSLLSVFPIKRSCPQVRSCWCSFCCVFSGSYVLQSKFASRVFTLQGGWRKDNEIQSRKLICYS